MSNGSESGDSGETQIIVLQNNDGSATYKVSSKDTEIRATKTQNRVVASNKIKVNKIVSYDWEQKYNYGNIFAIHKNNEFYAYTLRGKTAGTGTVRLFHKKSNLRSLLKSFNGRVIDLSFAHCDEILLGCINEKGSVQVFKLELDRTPEIKAEVVFDLSPSLPIEDVSKSSDMHRIIWCMYIPENELSENISEDASKVFAVTINNQIDIYRLDLIQQHYGPCIKPFSSDEIQKGHLRINEHESTILTASFSPDGSAIASSSMNGEVIFFKLSFDENEPPKCLQKWKPHEDKPVTCLYFLDDHKNSSPNAQFWSYILTGCDYNREIKLWSCVQWNCLQTIRFTSDDDIQPCLKTAIDLSSNYLVMSDINRKVFYVLHIYQDPSGQLAKIYAISEYPLAYPALSYVIYDSNRLRTKKFSRLMTSTNADNNENDDSENWVTNLQLYCIQTNQLQEMQIIVNSEPSLGTSTQSPSILNNFSRLSSSMSFNSDLKDHLSDVLSDLEQDLNNSRSNIAAIASNTSFITTKDNQAALNISNNINNNSNNNTILHAVSPTTPILLTPDAFSTNSQRRLNNDIPATAKQTQDVLQSFLSNSSRASSLTHITSCINVPINNHVVVNTPVVTTTTTTNTTPSTITTTVNNTAALLTTATPYIPASASVDNLLDNLEQKQEDKTLLQQNRISSISSDSSSSSSSSSSSGLSDAADKEIEEISLPNTNDYKPNNSLITSIPDSQPNEENINDKLNYLYLKDEQKKNPHTTPNSALLTMQNQHTASSNLLSKVDMLDNEFDNDGDNVLAEVPSDSQPIGANINLDAANNHQNWPNPPLLGANTAAHANKRPKNSGDTLLSQQTDPNLIHELLHMMRNQQNDIELLKKQQINTILSLKSHFDSTIQTLRQQQNTITQTSSSLSLNEENLTRVMNQAVVTQIIPNLEKIIKDEIRQSIQPQVTKIVEPVREQLSKEIGDKLRSIENVLKENITKMFKSKSFLDSINASVGNSIQTTVVNSYRDTFQKIIIPGFEKSCQNMYQQINATFKKGTDDYIQELETYLKLQRKNYEEQKDPVINQIKQYNDNFQSTITELNTTLTNSLQARFNQNLQNSNAVLQDIIIASVKAIIKEELNVAMKDQQQNLPERLINVMRQSGTMTPIVHSASGTSATNAHDPTNELETKQRIMFFLQKGQLNNAFQTALCAADLNLLMNVCETVNPTTLFESKPCPLQQPVLLSLIQQLSQELNLHTELKVKYLEEALMNLDQTNNLTREHMPKVIEVLMNKLMQYINTHPNEKTMLKQMKMLLMASQSLTKS